MERAGRRPGRQQGLAGRLLAPERAGGSGSATMRPGSTELLQSLGDPGGCLVVMEASGGYERTAHRALVAQGVLAAIVNPKRVRDFARGMGLEAKTDRVDARLIARYGAVMRPAATPLPDPARLELREILACRRQLIDEIAVRRQQLEHLQSPAVRAQGRAGPGLPAPGGQGAAGTPARDGSRPIRRSPPTSPCSPRCPAAARSWPPPCWPRCPSSAPSTGARSQPSPASPRSPGTAACASTAGSSRAAAARSAAPSTWPPSPASRPTRAP